MAGSVHATVVGDSGSVDNTFEDTTLTGGAEFPFGDDRATVVDPGVEFPAFIGFYDIDVSENAIEMTFVDNSGASDLVIPADRYDRYYYTFGANKVTFASLAGSAELNEFAPVTVLNSDFAIPNNATILQFGGLLVEFGEDTNLTNTDVTANINFTTGPIPEPTSVLLNLVGIGLVTLKRRRV